MLTTEKRLITEQLFPTAIIRAIHPELTALIEPLRGVIMEHKGTATGISRSNMGGWHSAPNMDRWGGGPAQALVSIACGLTEQTLIQKSPMPGLEMGWGVDMWANVNGAGHANAQHCHPGAFASAVFYVDLGNQGAPAKDGHIVFEDPRYPMAHMQQPSVLWPGIDGQGVESQSAVLPEAGEMIIFPSWMRHSVKPHSGSGERISIAINLSLVWKSVGAPS